MNTFYHTALLCSFFLFCVKESHSQNPGINSLADQFDSLRLQKNIAQPFLKNKSTAIKGMYKSSLSALTSGLAIQRETGNESATCFDTSGRVKIGKDSLLLYSGQSFPSADGNFLIPGQYAYYASPRPFYGAFLIKADKRGNVLWAQYYDSLNASPNHWLNFYKVLELRDGSILLGGSGNEPVSDNNDFIITKTDASGNVIWTKDMYSRLWTNGSGSADYFYLHQWQQDPFTDDIFMCGPSWAKGILVMRMNSATGNFIWSNAYMLNSNGYVNDRIAGLVIRQNELVAIGTYANYNSHILIYRLNRDNGDTLSTKMLQLDQAPYYKYSFIAPGPVQVLNNGDIAFGGWQGGYWEYLYNGVIPLYQAGVAVLNQDFNFKHAFSFRNNIESNGYNTEVTIHPDGSGVFTMLEVLSGFSGREIIAHFKDSVITRQRNRYFNNEGYPWEPFYHQLPNGNELNIRLVGDSIHNFGDLVFSNLSDADTASQCMGFKDNITSTSSFSYSYQGYIYADSIKRNIFHERRPRQVVAFPFTTDEPEAVCGQTSFCDSLSISSLSDTVCSNAPILINIHKNKECGSAIQFLLPGNADYAIETIDDTTYQITFRSAWEGYIHAQIRGCTDLKDSLFFKVYGNPEILNLGTDFSICPDNQIMLIAQPGYAAYQWQDGSQLPYFQVEQPGIYYVMATDGCGNRFYDTVNVSAQPAFPLSIGNDREICRGDRINLTADAGFINYQWSPAYNISSTTGIQVEVYPQVDTFYTVKAEKMPGCFSHDTVRIRVNTSPVINLGSDQDLCEGQQALLDAGAGFSNYVWSNGSPAQQLPVTSSGLYHVMGTTSDGCRAYDTIHVRVHSNPSVHLGSDGPVCAGGQRILSAPQGLADYLWNDGSILPSLAVSAPGTYWVHVTDVNNCKTTDTVIITRLIEKPSDFLAYSDTSICSYGTLLLQPVKSYDRYLWSNAGTTASITISEPGVYILQVTDEFGCTGFDSIRVTQKQCLKGLYVPTAFTPNNDHKNDQLKALLFGNVQYFEFSVFNRYGQLVFTTRDPSKGWNGSIKNAGQPTGNYVWICRYKINNESEKFAKGSTLLIR